MLNIFEILIQSLLIQYIIIGICKNILSYTEEIYLYLTYISLFIILGISSLNSIRNFVIKDSFNIMYFYETLYYIKLIYIYTIKKYNDFLKKKQIYKYILKLIYNFFFFKNYIFKKEEMIKKLELIKKLQILILKKI